MTIELGQLKNGQLILGKYGDFSHDILRVEYYSEQQLFLLVYDTPDQDSELMRYELDNEIAQEVIASPGTIIIAMAEEGGELYGYDVPLVKVTN